MALIVVVITICIYTLQQFIVYVRTINTYSMQKLRDIFVKSANIGQIKAKTAFTIPSMSPMHPSLFALTSPVPVFIYVFVYLRLLYYDGCMDACVNKTIVNTSRIYN